MAAKNAHNNHHHNPKPCKSTSPSFPASLTVIPAQAGNHRAGRQQDKPINPGPSFPRRRESTWRRVTRVSKTTQPPIPLSLDGRVSKVRVKKPTPTNTSARHTGFKAVSTGWGDNKPTPTPSRHCGLDPQSRGEAAGLTTRQPHQRVIPSKARNLKSPTTSPRTIIPYLTQRSPNDAPASSQSCKSS